MPSSWTRDNDLVYVHTGVVNEELLGEAVSEAVRLLDTREVRHVRFTLGPDPYGDPSIFFAILLTPYGAHASGSPASREKSGLCSLTSFNPTIDGDFWTTLTSPTVWPISKTRATCNPNGVRRRPVETGISSPQQGVEESNASKPQALGFDGLLRSLSSPDSGSFRQLEAGRHARLPGARIRARNDEAGMYMGRECQIRSSDLSPNSSQVALRGKNIPGGSGATSPGGLQQRHKDARRPKQLIRRRPLLAIGSRFATSSPRRSFLFLF